MKDLLRTYLFRLKKTKAIWIVRIVRIGLVLLATIGIGSRNVKTINAYKRQGTTVEYAGLFSRRSRFTRFLSPSNTYWLITLLLLYFFVTTDWSNHTFRNRCLAGKSRTLIYWSGILFSFLLFLGRYIIRMLIVLIMGYAFPYAENYYPSTRKPTGSLPLICFAFFLILLFRFSLRMSIAYRVKSRAGFLIPVGVFLIGTRFTSIVNGVVSIHNYSYNATTPWNVYPFLEFFPTYQNSAFGGGIRNRITSVFGNTSDYDQVQRAILVNGQIQYQIVFGRTAPLLTKTVIVNLLLASSFLALGNYVFFRKDRK